MPDPDFSVNDVKMFVGKTSHSQQSYLVTFFRLIPSSYEEPAAFCLPVFNQ